MDSDTENTSQSVPLADPLACRLTSTSMEKEITKEEPENYKTALTTCEHEERSLYSEEIIGMWNLHLVYRELGTVQKCVEFAEKRGMVSIAKECRTHRKPMILSPNKTFGLWTCRRGRCQYRASRAIGTFFENCKVELVHVFYLIYSFAHKWPYDMTIHEDPYKLERGKCLSMGTISDWIRYCREVVVISHMEMCEAREKVGGVGKIVQVGEFKFQRGKTGKFNLEGHFALGIVEVGSEDFRLEVILKKDLSEEVLQELIEKHIKKGSKIRTNCSMCIEMSKQLSRRGYIIKTFNPFLYTPKGSQWTGFENFCRRNYKNTANFAELAIEYLWRKNIKKMRKDPFIEMINAINQVYVIKNPFKIVSEKSKIFVADFK